MKASETARTSTRRASTRACSPQILRHPSTRPLGGAFYSAIEDAIKENDQRIEAGEPAKPIGIKPPGNTAGNRDASWLYNARMHPVVPYAIRGAIWNQGYANIGGGMTYYHNLHSLVRGWRQAWDRPDLPVYFHQFYSSGVDELAHPTLGKAAGMRQGTAKGA